MFEAPRNANHEANAPNRWQVALLVAIAAVLAVRAWRGRDRRRAAYALSLMCGFLAFCAYLKWQPFMGRLILPLLVAASPLAAVVEEWGPTPRFRTGLQVALCLFLANNARPAAFENWTRPLRGPGSVLHVSRETQYFADMTQWDNAGSYTAATAVLQHSRCRVIGIDIQNLQLEYPLQALLRRAIPQVRFVHTGVGNASARYAPSVPEAPCAVACLDCKGDTTRLSLYQHFSNRAETGKFVLLWETPH